MHLLEVVLAAPAPRTGGGDRPPLWVQGRASLSPGSVGGEHARRQAHIVHMVRSRCGRARAPTLPEDPLDPYHSRISSMSR